MTVDTRRVFAGDAVPATAAGFDGLVVMGGPMSAASDHGFPTRSAELSLLSDAVRAEIPTFGVCLGAQLLAAAGGGAVLPGEGGPEIGWGPVALASCRDGDRLFSDLPDELTVLHWHGETFKIPPGGVRIAGNRRYTNQAFRLGGTAWGVQFHLEVNSEAVGEFLAAFGADADAVPGGPELIEKSTPGAVEELRPARDLVLGRFAALVGGRTAGPLPS